MRKKGRKKVHLMLLLYVLVLVFECAGCSMESTKKATQKESSTEDKNTDTFEGLLTYFMDTDSYDYDEKKLEPWKEKKKEAILAEHDADQNGDGMYVRTSFLLYDGKTDQAQKKLCEVIKKTDNDKIKGRCHFELSRIYAQKEQYEKAEKEVDQIEKIFKNKEDPDFLILLNTQIYADLLEWPDGVNKAVALMEKTKKLAESCEYEKKEEVLAALAVCYYYSGEELKGMEAKVEGLSLAEEHNNIEMVRKISADIGIDYMVAEDYEKAVEYLQKSRSIILKQNEQEDQELLQFHVYVANNLVGCYVAKKDTAQAWKQLKEVKEVIEKEEEGKRKTDDITYSMSYEAQYYTAKKEYDKALALMDEVKERYEETDYFYYMNFDIGYREVYGELYNAMGEYEKALKYWKEVADLYKAQGVDTPDDICLGGFYNAYSGMGDYKNALKYKNQMYDGLSKSFKGKEKEQANYLLEKFESDKREKEITTLQTRNRILWIVVGFAVVFVIVTLGFTIVISRKSKEIRRLNQKFRELSEKDGLTGLYNRRAMDIYLDQNWEKLMEENASLCVLMLDVDYFKKYNDFYGHQGGDEVLRKVSRVIAQKSRKDDMAVRYGGEEFVVILPGITIDSAKQAAERIREGVKALSISHEKSDVADYVSVSIGVAQAQAGLNSDQVLKRADDALYEAKKTRNTVCVFEG
ncbi:MAG: diguanylate cyclase [Lachnospiraceae bacterium]